MDGVGKRSHDGQPRNGRRINLDLANVGADGVALLCLFSSITFDRSHIKI